MNIETLDLKHQKVINEHFKKLKFLLSEYAFSNLYLFRKIHSYHFIESNGYFTIQGITRDQLPYLMLMHPFSTEYMNMIQQVMKNLKIQYLFPVPDEYLKDLDPLVDSAYFNEGESDYLYQALKLAYYPGRHLGKKRNLVQQLFDHYDVKSEPLTNQNAQDAKKVLEAWEKELANPEISNDFTMCLEAFELLDQLNLGGRIIYADSNPVGFVIGEWLNEDCYSMHFGKALKNVKGSYQYLDQSFAGSIDRPNSWINFEQDLNIPSLRESKMSYLPDKILKKWRVKLKL
ncbi:MAG: phosphatidylglycerol lysyltransferase domain-containing protein [Parachlamydiaceae bacterium]|nr:phosphatidylglycerol lysyltransferase domain-containing protein [Parachlamydiaceae bacterium]